MVFPTHSCLSLDWELLETRENVLFVLVYLTIALHTCLGGLNVKRIMFHNVIMPNLL